MKKTNLAIAAILAALTFSPMAHAQPPGPPPGGQGRPTQQNAPMKIGFVDIELIIENSQAIRKALDVMDEQMAEQAREIDALERDFRAKRFDLDRQERVLSKEERAKRVEELAAITEEINQRQFDLDQELRDRERQIAPVLEKIMEIVSDVAERDGFALVLRGEVVIYGARQVNLTPAVVEEIDRREAEIVALFAGTEPAVPSDDLSTTQPATGAMPPPRETMSGSGAERPRRPSNNDDVLPLIP